MGSGEWGMGNGELGVGIGNWQYQSPTNNLSAIRYPQTTHPQPLPIFKTGILSNNRSQPTLNSPIVMNL